MNDMATAPADTVMRTVDGTPLKVSLRRAMRRRKLAALGLVMPLFVFILFSFILPIADMLFRSVENPQVVTIMPETTAALQGWDGNEVPDEAVFAALVADLVAGSESREIGKVATRLNYEISGMRGLIMKSARRADRLEAPYREALIDLDKDWNDISVWKLIQREGAPFTASYYLSAIDMRYDDSGEIAAQPTDRQIYVTLFLRTLWISLLITFMTLLLGFPVAYLLATLPLKYSNLLMIMVLLPFWTSLLVRTTSWIAMLQQQGVLNDLLVWSGLVSDDGRLELMHNQTGTVVAMTHILLPFMVLPLYSVMRTISPSFMRAAQSLGAPRFLAFWRVYAPLTLPGVGAGAILVFILAIGYYITPALVGGTSGQLISNFIAYHMQSSLNWGLAAALGSILLSCVLLLYYIYNRIVGIENMKLG
ncbi:MAG: ABC transporter permease [Geminicoccaceae bacterium]|nr:ABC transporter permease [Geminicoccaceae bacterium]